MVKKRIDAEFTTPNKAERPGLGMAMFTNGKWENRSREGKALHRDTKKLITDSGFDTTSELGKKLSDFVREKPGSYKFQHIKRALFDLLDIDESESSALDSNELLLVRLGEKLGKATMPDSDAFLGRIATMTDTPAKEPTEEKHSPNKKAGDVNTSGVMVGGAAVLDAGGDLDHEDPAVQREMMSTEAAVVNTNATNKANDQDKSELTAAGDSGLGNAMKYDFITAEGRGPNTGQKIQRGDQKGQRDAATEFDTAMQAAKGKDVNTEGQNKTDLTQEMLMTRANAQGSDSILDPIAYDRGRASLRPQFLLGGEDAVRKTGRERLEMDVQFDMFDFVPEGFGLGAHNKMFVQEQNRERLIRYAEPMYEPRPVDGSELDREQFDPRLQPQIHGIEGWMTSTMNEMSALGQEVKKQNVRSVDTLADDNNTQTSSKGLPGRKPSPFETVINTKSPFIPVVEPAGVNMKRQLKSIFNTQRTPMKNVEYNPHNGTPTLATRRAMEIILP